MTWPRGEIYRFACETNFVACEMTLQVYVPVKQFWKYGIREHMLMDLI